MVMAMTNEMTKLPFCSLEFYFIFHGTSFIMVVYGRVVLAIRKQSFLAQLFCKNNGKSCWIFESPLLRRTPWYDSEVNLTIRPWFPKGRSQTVFRILYPGTIKPDTLHTLEM